MLQNVLQNVITDCPINDVEKEKSLAQRFSYMEDRLVKILSEHTQELQEKEGILTRNLERGYTPIRISTLYTPLFTNRYKLKAIPRNGFDEGSIIDSIMPNLLAKVAKFDPEEISKTLYYNRAEKAYTLSRYFSARYNIRRMPLEHQIKALGYDLAEVKRWVREVASQDYRLVLLGYGGLNLNVVENLKELLDILNVRKLFLNVSLYEPDTLSFHNIWRMSSVELLQNALNVKSPMALYGVNDTETSVNVRKVHLAQTGILNRLSKGIPNINYTRFRESHIDYEVHQAGRRRDEPAPIILFGAPDIITRERLYNERNRRIARKETLLIATHNDNTYSLYNYPKVESTLQTETYGSLDLTPFFFNMLDLTLQLLKHLAQGAEAVLNTPLDTQIVSNTFNPDTLDFSQQALKGHKYNIPQTEDINPGGTL